MEVPLPFSAQHHYSADSKLLAIKKPTVEGNFVNRVIQKTHVMSAYQTEEMVFLFADDYHKLCFSCSEDFYGQYMRVLRNQNLIDL